MFKHSLDIEAASADSVILEHPVLQLCFQHYVNAVGYLLGIIELRKMQFVTALKMRYEMRIMSRACVVAACSGVSAPGAATPS